MMADHVYRYSYVDKKNGNIVDVYQNGGGQLFEDDRHLTPVAADAAGSGNDAQVKPGS